MKRDMDLIRKILLRIEASNNALDMNDILDLGESEQQIAYHLELLLDAGLINAIDACTKTGDNYMDLSLTWDGHEFLEAARDPSRWEQARLVAGKAGMMTFDILKEILAKTGAEAVKILMFGS